MTDGIQFDLLALAPELFLAVMAMALLMVGVLRTGAPRVVTVAAIVVLAVAAGLALSVSGQGADGAGTDFLLDPFAVAAKLLVYGGAALALVLAAEHLGRERLARPEFPVLVLFTALGQGMMVSANDFLALYVGLELQSLALYVLASFHRDDQRSTEAGLKYFVLGALSSGLLLFGISLIYGATGHTGFAEVAAALGPSAATALPGGEFGLTAGLVLVLAGLAFKISAVPFHMWTPDVYEGAPTSVTALFAMAPKVAALALLARVLTGPFGDVADQWQQIIAACAVLSMAVGGFGAIGQPNIKRLMAYSSIGHIGFALVGLAAGTQEGLRGVLVYLAIYVPMSAGTFAVLLAMRRNGVLVEGIADLAGLSRTRPRMAAAMAVLMFSMAGIPPLAGFFAKLFVFQAAVQVGLIPLAVIGVLTSVVSAFYYLRIVKIMYFDEPAPAFDAPSQPATGLVMGLSAAAMLLFLPVAGPLLEAAGLAAAGLAPPAAAAAVWPPVPDGNGTPR